MPLAKILLLVLFVVPDVDAVPLSFARPLNESVPDADGGAEDPVTYVPGEKTAKNATTPNTIAIASKITKAFVMFITI